MFKKTMLVLSALLLTAPCYAQGRDTNNDGKISKEEFLAMPIKRFEAKDKNNDGFLSEAEMQPPAAAKATPLTAEQKAARKARRAAMQKKRQNTSSEN